MSSEFFYDKYGRLEKFESYQMANGNSQFNSKRKVLQAIEAKKNAVKGIESSTKITDALATGSISYYRRFRYSSSGTLASIVSYYYDNSTNKLMIGDSTVYVANKDGKLVSGKLWNFYDYAPDEPEFVNNETYYYDAIGQLIKIKYDFIDYPEENYEDVFTYDARGNVVPKALVADKVGDERHEITRVVKYDNSPNVVGSNGILLLLGSQSDNGVLYLSKNNVLENIDEEKFIATNGSSRSLTAKAKSVFVYGANGKPTSQEVVITNTANIYGNINSSTVSYKHFFEYVQ
ncbi:hypothetical protein D3C72_585930 [compost metagenome]